MERIGIALYAACVDFLLRVATICGVTYRDANAALFFLVWPAVTAALLAVVLRQRAALRRLRRGGKD
jgi:hypothetical protein